MNATEKTLKIGLTMDGSVSAGAYIAGVMDYLLEILDAWQQAKTTNDETIPQHDIVIEVMTGASGGGISTAISVLEMFQKRYPVIFTERNNAAYLNKNKLYDAWVNLSQKNMIPALLDTSDITQNKKIVSLLNSSFIDNITQRVISYDPHEKSELPAYINANMQLIISLSNLEGFKYNIKFSGVGSTAYLMTQHRDFAFFEITEEYHNKGRIPLYPSANKGITELAQASQATAAFPIGLAYRLFEREKKYVLDNTDLINKNLELVEPTAAGGRIYSAYFVDGGLMNNEPFDIAENILGMKENSCEDDFEKTIIMIQPFPSEDFTSTDKKAKGLTTYAEQSNASQPKFPYSLFNVIGRIYSTMRTQLRFKDETIAKAVSDDHSRFIISPRRVDAKNNKTYNGSIAIACGVLDGFGGFLDEEFRRHDFFLGRKNCQGFVQDHFRVHENTINPIFKNGYSAAAKNKFRFQDQDEVKKLGAAAAPWYLPIIPDVKYPNSSEQGYPYPKYPIEGFDKYKDLLLSRLKLIVLIGSKNWLGRQLRLIGFLLFKNRIYNLMRDKLKTELQKWNL